ncbi:MAG: hypothetical protein AB1896_12045 [Thermodesulfobacteriota bacterium]
MADKDDFELDEEAQKLFAELGGVEFRPRAKDNLIGGSQSLAEALGEEEKLMDEWRIHLVEFAHHLAVCLAGFKLPGAGATLRDSQAALQKTLDQLYQMPHHGGVIMVRYRGLGQYGEGKHADRSDYVISFGSLDFDLAAVKAVTKRRGLTMSHLTGRLARAFEVLATLNVSNLHLNLGKWSQEEAQKVGLCLAALRGYFQAVESGATTPDQQPASGPPAVVLDEGHQPNPNLTLLAALNKMKLESIQALVRKVDLLMRQTGPAEALESCTNVFEALFAFKNLREKLVRPPLEVNNVRWLIAGRDQGLASKEEIKVARKVMDKFGGSPQAAAKVVNSIYGRDMARLDAEDLGGRLGTVSDFLNEIERDESDRDMTDEVLRNIEERLDEVPDEVLEELILDASDSGPVAELFTAELETGPETGTGAAAFMGLGDLSPDLVEPVPIPSGAPGDREAILMEAEAVPGDILADVTVDRTGPRPAPAAGLNRKLYDLAAFFKRRSVTKKKIKQMLRQPIDFDAQDFQVIARDFQVSVQAAEELLALLRGCFDRDGRFLRAAFEKNIPRFASYEKRVFGFLWHYLKEIMQREDRVAFLNALQLLIAKMAQHVKALDVLLDDFLHPSDQVSYSDRNALMLANILLRKYNKELRNDVEITPEEVLLVRDGLDPEVVAHASAYLEREQESLFEKVRTIHKKLKESQEAGGQGNGSVMPARYLYTLEREVYIFLSLVGGNTGHATVRSAVREYGDPAAEVYHLDESTQTLKANIQLLQVAVRGLGRFGDSGDSPILAEIKRREDDFLKLSRDPGSQELTRRMIKWT